MLGMLIVQGRGGRGKSGARLRDTDTVEEVVQVCEFACLPCLTHVKMALGHIAAGSRLTGHAGSKHAQEEYYHTAAGGRLPVCTRCGVFREARMLSI